MRYLTVRKAMATLVQCALNWKLITVAGLAWVWIAAGVSILARIGVWEGSFIKETILWAAFSGTVSLDSRSTLL